MRNSIITGVLLILAGVMIALHFQQDAQIKRQLIQHNLDLSTELERTELELRRSENSRDSLFRISDSIMVTTLDLKLKLKAKDIEISKIKGRYKEISVDSLAVIMNERAWKRGN